MNEKGRQLKVYTVIEKPGRRSMWLEIGVASENRDGTIGAKLDAVPTNGVIQLREEDVCPEEMRAREHLRELKDLIDHSEWDSDLRQVLVDELEEWK